MVAIGEADVSVQQTEDGRRLVVSHPVDASRDAVWTVLTDTALWPDWGPSLTDVEVDTRVIEDGTTGRVRTVGGLWLPFEVTACRAHRWTWDVARIPATGHRADAGPLGSRVVFEIPVLAAGYVPVCVRACRNVASLAAGESAPEP
ncbi:MULTISPECIES: SRPBCC family protein [Haloarcula]|uniref:SRPBCC family protein n=1 Tax=Haloarcula TaxID=2237 RepID=UPI0023EDDCA0|nr:SRPBCC family protein [Halomicroarcula sp. XH51]